MGRVQRQGGGILAAACVIMLLAACAAKQPEQAKAPEAPKKHRTQKHETARPESPPPATFIQEGLAGSYNRDFYGSGVKSSEKYDVQGMTAVHRTLPKGIMVKVRNRENGKEVVVRIIDHGPFVKGRIMDLSYAAAKKLGISGKGSAEVGIETLGFRSGESEAYRQPANFDKGLFTVQIGMFASEKNAARISSEMRGLFRFSEIHEARAKGKKVYRVYAGTFTSLREAEAAERNFTEHGYPASVVLSLE